MSTESGFCHKCGAQLPPGASFCSKCGASVASFAASTGQSQPAQLPMYRREKGEKHEKREKGEKHEKGGDPLVGAIVGGLVLIWLGFSFYLAQAGFVAWTNWWAYFLIGLGLVLILQTVLIKARTGKYIQGPLIGGAVVLVIGFASITNYSTFWPLILVVIGIAIIAGAAIGRRRTPQP